MIDAAKALAYETGYLLGKQGSALPSPGTIDHVLAEAGLPREGGMLRVPFEDGFERGRADRNRKRKKQ